MISHIPQIVANVLMGGAAEKRELMSVVEDIFSKIKEERERAM